MIQKKTVTFNDIAAYTNFSKTTISRYFNRPDSVTPANQKKIREALDALGYQENKVARILAKGKTELIGVIFPNLYLHYFSDLLNQILATYTKFGYKFMVYTGAADADEVRSCIREMLAYQVEGLIIMDHQLPSDELSSFNVPVVTIEREDEFVSSVNCDNYMGAVQAVSLLAKNNCDVFLHINTPTPESFPSYQRITGFNDFCEENGLLHRVYIRETGIAYDGIASEMEKLLDEIEADFPGKRIGVFFSDDTRANAFVNALTHRHRRFPDNFRVVGFDNSPISWESACPFSTIGQQTDKIAETALDILNTLIHRREEDPDSPLEPIHKVITPIVIRRNTTD